MRYKLKKDNIKLKEKDILITLEDLKYMNEAIKKDNNINGFIFGFEKL